MRGGRSKFVSLCAAFLALAGFARAEPPSPFTKGPYLIGLSSHGVTVRAEVDPPSGMAVHLEADGKTVDARDDAATAMHSLAIEGLAPRTSYRYTVTVGTARASGTFSTAPPDGDASAVSFLIYGDNRTDPVQHASVVRSMLPAPADFLIHTGDFVDDGANASNWQSFFDTESPLLRNHCLFATVGNHELSDSQGASWLRFFGSSPAQATHSLNDTVRWGSIRFFFLNGWGSLRSGSDRTWLNEALAASDAEKGVAWRFLVTHHGPYSSGLHGSNERFVSADLEPVLRAHGVSLVISGHDHGYERGASGMLRYIVSGGGGAPLYPIGRRLPQTRRAASIYHYVRVTVTADQVSIAVIRPDGAQFESATFTANAARAWDDDDASVSATRPNSLQVDPSVAPPRAKSSGCGCSVPGEAQPAGSAWCLLAVGVLVLARPARRLRVAS